MGWYPGTRSLLSSFVPRVALDLGRCRFWTFTPSVGTSAGVPLAGLVACASLSNVTRRIKRRFIEKGLATYFPTDAAETHQDPEGIMEWDTHHDTCNFGIIDDDFSLHLSLRVKRSMQRP